MLYLIVLHVAWRCTGAAELLKRHLKTAETCLQWIDHYGDRDGDGFQEYATRSPVGYENQSWKEDCVTCPQTGPFSNSKFLAIYNLWVDLCEQSGMFEFDFDSVRNELHTWAWRDTASARWLCACLCSPGRIKHAAADRRMMSADRAT
jgi:hypothetical protein